MKVRRRGHHLRCFLWDLLDGGNRDSRPSFITPTVLVNHLLLLLRLRNLLDERLDGRHGILGVKVISWRLNNWRRNSSHKFFSFPLYLLEGLVEILDLIDFLGVLNHHDHPLIGKMSCCCL